MSESDRKLRNKRAVRLTVVMFVLVVTFYILGINGYWIDTRELVVKEYGVPDLFGSIWFNLFAILLPGLAVLILEDGELNMHVSVPRGISYVLVCLTAIFSPFVGLFAVVVSLIAIVIVFGTIIAVGLLFPELWKFVPDAVKSKMKQIAKWIWTTIFWPEK